MSDYRVFSGTEQRELAQQIAADLNGGRTLERHAEIAATVLTSDWLTAHDAKVRADALEALANDEADWAGKAWRSEEAETVTKMRKAILRRAAEYREKGNNNG